MENGYKLTQNHLCNSSRGVMVAHLTTDQKVLGSSPSADVFLLLRIWRFPRSENWDFWIWQVQPENYTSNNSNFPFSKFSTLKFWGFSSRIIPFIPQRSTPFSTSTVSLVVEYDVAIVVARVQFPDSALFY